MNVPPRAAAPALLQVDAIVSRLSGRQALSELCRFLVRSFRQYRWVGIYRLEGTTLVLDAWDGPAPTEHVRIPVERGVCGRAAREGRTVIVDDVRADPEYLACFLETRAEIVVPIRAPAGVIGEIDVDGTRVAAFDESDRQLLEAIAAKLTAAVERAAAEPPPS